MSCKKPNFFILGAPKCGTSSMYEWLGEHPQIYMSSVKEPNFYNFDNNLSSVRSKKEYLKLFNDANDSHEVIGEASIMYLYSTEAVVNIEQDLDDPKYVVMLRDPIDMVISYYQTLLFTGVENIESFNAAWEAIEERKQGEKIPMLCREESHLYYDEVCSLGKQLERVFVHVDKKRVKVIFLDDMKANPQECYKEVLEFLNVDQSEKANFSVSNKAKVVKSQTLLTIIRGCGWLIYKFNLPRLHYGFIDKINDLISKPEKKEIEDEKLKQELRGFFRSDIEKIEKLIHRDLSHWKDKTPA